MSVTALDAARFDWSRGAGGADDVRRIVELSFEHDGRSALDEAAVLNLRNRGLHDARMLTATHDDSSDSAAGFAYLHGLADPTPAVDLVVSPNARGHGLGRELAVATVESTDGPLTAWSHGNHPAAAALAKRCGFDAVRELWLMRRPSAGPFATEVPEGYTIRPYRPGVDDVGFLSVNAAAFASHPEQGSLDRRGLLERMAEPWFDPKGFLIAERDGEIVGFHWTKVHTKGRLRASCGEVYVIGVDPSTQGSGLGRALLMSGLEHLRRRGLSEVILYVEAQNEGAVRLYERHGFKHAAVDTDVMYARS
jgi:mycothiol synthase